LLHTNTHIWFKLEVNNNFHVEIGWTEPVDTYVELLIEKNARLANDKALYALCQALSPSEFTKISNCETAQKAWQILETTYEGICQTSNVDF
jgi:hypothetical protein